jgi:ribosomal protein S18 acetylase RimI-like enzyme
MNGAIVAPASLGDVPVLMEMMRDFYAFEEITFTAGALEPALRHLLSAAELGHVGLVREREGGPVVGYFIVTWGFDLEWNGRDAILTDLYLRPETRGRGVGRAVMEAIESVARAAGASALHLMVRHVNDPALRLYLRAGFTTPERRFMTKPLRERT